MLRELTNLIKNSEVIGLDIGTHSIKMVEIDHRKNELFLSTYAIAPHSVSLDGYWDASTLRTIARLIENMMHKSNFVGAKTVMSVRSKDVYVTTMEFDAELDEKTIRTTINQQAPFFLPLPPEQMRLSYDLLKAPTVSGKRRVVINATPDYIVENSRNLLEHLNLDGEAIENQTLSQIRACLPKSNTTSILVDMGGHHTVFSIIVNSSLRSSTYIPSGTQDIATTISQLLGANLETGESFMKDLNLVDLEHLPKPFLDYLTVLKSELEIFVGLNQQIGQNPTEIICTGGGAHTPGLMNFFKGFSIPIRIAHPLENILLEQNLISYITPVSNQLSTAIGLAKRVD